MDPRPTRAVAERKERRRWAPDEELQRVVAHLPRLKGSIDMGTSRPPDVFLDLISLPGGDGGSHAEMSRVCPWNSSELIMGGLSRRLASGATVSTSAELRVGNLGAPKLTSTSHDPRHRADRLWWRRIVRGGPTGFDVFPCARLRSPYRRRSWLDRHTGRTVAYRHWPGTGPAPSAEDPSPAR